MKKTITLIASLILSIGQAQVVADFESFTLTPNSYYQDVTGADWQTANAVFRYHWDTNFGGFWSSGFAYTNKNDSINGNFSNLYNCMAYKGYNNSNYYVTGQNGGIITLKSPNNSVSGFYITNTTYAYKSMKNGDSFARKFGDTTGTGCGCPQGSYPDWFKVTVKGYLNGTMKTDSTEFYLADFRFSNNTLDYIVKNWQWVNTSNLGSVDSICFFMYSSDVGSFGMNTPAFFSIDNFTTSQLAGINELSYFKNLKLYPNPASDEISVDFISESETSFNVYDVLGNKIYSDDNKLPAGKNNYRLDLSYLNSGFYFIELNNGINKQMFRFIKE